MCLFILTICHLSSILRQANVHLYYMPSLLHLYTSKYSSLLHSISPPSLHNQVFIPTSCHLSSIFTLACIHPYFLPFFSSCHARLVIQRLSRCLWLGFSVWFCLEERHLLLAAPAVRTRDQRPTVKINAFNRSPSVCQSRLCVYSRRLA